MTPIDISAAKTLFSQIVDRASRGESFVITQSGTPLARLMPPDSKKPAKIRFGLMKGGIHIGPDFDAPLDIFEEGPSA
ncbi:type II toxin-antitoxin system Phd/YefM family antitoxin [Inquilinus sp. NPDC058860]|uniref:type II toxin-antitoxin system Phd/YefM family antitoxin n=1 Tax=Inquilinus sp. NPDC058860 TaxID=3346652 RepID=UPI0036803893